MLQDCRDISYGRKMILKSIGLNKSYKEEGVKSLSSKYNRYKQINECIRLLQEKTTSDIDLLKSYATYTFKHNSKIYQAIYDKLIPKFKKDFQKHIKDFDTDYTRQTNEAFIDVLTNFSQRAHLNARKQILMTKNIVVDEYGVKSFDRACGTIIDDIRLIRGNSRHTNTRILNEAFNYINGIAPWNVDNLVMVHRDPIAAITVLLQTWWKSTMIGSLSQYNRESFTISQCKIADACDATNLGIPINDRYFCFPTTPWFVAKGDECSGMKNIPVENRRRALIFEWSVILASNELSQSRHAAVLTLTSGLPAQSELIVSNVQSQVQCFGFCFYECDIKQLKIYKCKCS